MSTLPPHISITSISPVCILYSHGDYIMFPSSSWAGTSPIKVLLTLVSCTSITISPLYTLRSWWKDSCSTISRAISTKPQNGQSSQSRTSPSQEPSSTSATSHSAWKATLLNGNLSTGCEHGESPTPTPPTKSPPPPTPPPTPTITRGPRATGARKGKERGSYSMCVCVFWE